MSLYYKVTVPFDYLGSLVAQMFDSDSKFSRVLKPRDFYVHVVECLVLPGFPL